MAAFAQITAQYLQLFAGTSSDGTGLKLEFE